VAAGLVMCTLFGASLGGWTSRKPIQDSETTPTRDLLLAIAGVIMYIDANLIRIKLASREEKGMITKRVLIASFMALTLLLTACGSDTGSAGTTAVSDTGSAVTTAVSDTGSVATTAVSDTGSADTPFEKKDPLKIGYSVYDLQSPYWQAYTKGIQDQAAEFGIEVVIADQKSSEQNQVAGSADLINQGISALIVSPVQPPALLATIDAAHAAKIPVIIGDVGAEGDYDAFILSDNREGGAIAARTVVDLLGDVDGTKKVGVIELHSGSAVGDDRVGGFVDEIAKSAGFEVVAQIDGNDTVEGGFKAAQDMLAANPDLVAIYAANDPEAQGAARALDSAGKSVADGFVLIGFNGDSPSLDLIENDEQTATIAQDPYGQGRLAVRVALALLDGDTIEYTDAANRVIEFPVELVSADNLQAFREARGQ